MNRAGAVLFVALIVAVAWLVAVSRGDSGVAPVAAAVEGTPAIGDAGAVWVGAVLRDGSLLPFATWTTGGGWSRWPFYDRRQPAPKTLAEVPLTWLPRGTPPPSRWNASLFDGRRAIVQLRPAVRMNDFLQTLVLDTDVAVAPGQRTGASWAAVDLGVAVSGDAALRAFRDVPMDELTGVMRFADAAMSAAERNSLPPDTLARMNDEVRGGTPTEIETAVATTAADGRREFYVEAMRTYENVPGECKPLVRIAVAVEDSRGSRRLLDVRATALDACGHYVAHVPLAVVERGSARCWVVRRVYEDGIDFTLTAPGKAASDAQEIDCDLGSRQRATAR